MSNNKKKFFACILSKFYMIFFIKNKILPVPIYSLYMFPATPQTGVLCFSEPKRSDVTPWVELRDGAGASLK